MEAQHGFQALISYTERGFEPVAAAIHPGDTLRFTNNTGADLHLDVVGTSAVNGTGTIEPRRYLEVTFPKAGHWQYLDSTGAHGTVVVQ